MPAGLSNVVAVAAGGYHSLALGNVAPQAINQSVAGFPNRDLVIELRGFDTNADALNFWVTALPATGTLYQYDAGRRGAEITGGNPFVNDPAGRIIFAPTAGDFLSPYSSFAFAATDGLASSAPAEVVVSIALPPAPQLAGGGWRPDGAFVVSFAGHPNASDHLWASTNLIDWELIESTTMTSHGIFEAVDPRAAASSQRFYRASAP